MNAKLDDVFEDIVRVDLAHRPFASAGRIIIVEHQKRQARAVARGPAGAGKTGIILDSATRQKLGVQLNQQAIFTFQQASFWDEIAWAWNASNAMPRVAARLGLISVGLGLIGFLLGIISLAITFAQT